MNLTLTLSPSSHGKPGHSTSVARFDESGGTIGRAEGNSLVLPHNKVSGKHAIVTFRNGSFYLQDTSTNGTAVNNPSNRLVRNRPYALEDGDRVLIEPYEIDVAIEQQAARPLDRGEMFGIQGDDGVVSGSPDLASPAEALAGGEVDPLKLLGRGPKSGSGPAPRPPRPELPAGGVLGEYFRAPDVRPASPARPANGVDIPEDFDPFGPDAPSSATPMARPRPSPRPPVNEPAEPGAQPGEAPTPAPHAAPRGESGAKHATTPPHSSTSGADLLDLLRGAGLPDAAVTPELIRNVGEILRVVVQGLIDVLQARQRIKEELSLPQTIFRPSDNNPLKFSVNVEDALHNLLVKRNAAYLGPVEAFADAFDDLRDHQLAMLAGMRVAFEAMLAEFDPEPLQVAFDRELAKMTLPLVPAKLRYWELYRQRFADTMRDRDEAFQGLFGDDFARAYEEQFRRLKALRGKTGRGPRPPEPD